MLRSSAIVRSAQFDPTGCYRYHLGRHWQAQAPSLAILMLNPSQADHRRDDSTIRRCMCLAQSWGFGSIAVVNLFAYRTAYPRQLAMVADPIGPDNDRALLAAADQADRLLLAWGNGGQLHQRHRQVLNLLAPYRDRWCAIALNRTGQPRHPLYVKADAPLHSWAHLTGADL
ncbi:MAG TPA: DUF1643 domain-containing protein [Leptolyngbyaceae cyanobacterium M65_K2018_010]|nr:DUF1643 domain-containing protein [Leptolyngbyaceae cyanobacterium M65_K2018_010]